MTWTPGLTYTLPPPNSAKRWYVVFHMTEEDTETQRGRDSLGSRGLEPGSNPVWTGSHTSKAHPLRPACPVSLRIPLRLWDPLICPHSK